jgi:hypothetical protein
MPNGALSCGVLSWCHIVARFKWKDWLISQATGRQRAARQRARQDDKSTARQRAVCALSCCRYSDRTTRRKSDNAPFGALSCCRLRQLDAQKRTKTANI